jgi:monofunctional biosynthetic peptidoglycan transglycosylase
MIKRIFKFIGKLFLWFVAISVIWVALLKYIPVHITPLMVIRYFEEGNQKKWNHKWVPIEDISKNLQLAVICSEDQKFVYHNGFDKEAIEKAYEANQKGKKLRGASTISQQTAKNIFLWPQRSWTRKGIEVYFTFLIELIWDKERILEVYLNSIEMGDSVYGAAAASTYWFNKKPALLSADEAAAIAAILPNPRRYRANPASAYVQRQKAWVQQQMYYYGPLILTNNTSETKK